MEYEEDLSKQVFQKKRLDRVFYTVYIEVLIRYLVIYLKNIPIF